MRECGISGNTAVASLFKKMNVRAYYYFFFVAGENLNMEIQRKVVIATGVCTPSVENFEFTNWGNLRVDFGSGIINWVLTKIFNNYFSATLMGFLEAFNVSSMINNAVRGTVTTIIQETGQAETVCDFFKLLSM